MTIEDAQRVFGKEHDMTNIQQGTQFIQGTFVLNAVTESYFKFTMAFWFAKMKMLCVRTLKAST